ncbi:MAG TPA: YihY/virulence factor BrkB family protein [Bryobacteraceae bacterium]|nr:YihY/virulence factor BrkB family protein [Bryobacteraceae bacterium]
MHPVETVLTCPPDSRWSALPRLFRPTFRYWMETEVHVYAFSIAANVLLSFFPFLIVISYLCFEMLGIGPTRRAIEVVLNDYFGDNFVYRNLPAYLMARPELSVFSVFLLLFTANGIFVPLEVALNRAWGITKNRSYFKNQIISLGLIFVCGSLALLSTVLTGINAGALADGSALSRFLETLFYKIAAVPLSILSLFLIYWLLPNAKIDWRAVFPPAVVVGLGIEVFKYVNLLTYPLWLNKLKNEYGPFKYSVLILLWSFLGSLLLLAGAEWAARRAAAGKQPEPVRELHAPSA